MFGFRGGESPEIMLQKRDRMREAQRRWPFLTTFDASTIADADELAVLIAERGPLTLAEARAEVKAWMADGRPRAGKS